MIAMRMLSSDRGQGRPSRSRAFAPHWVQHLGERGAQCWQAALDHTPHQPVIDGGVAMDQHVPESHDAREVWNTSGQARLHPAQASEGLADDLELSLDRRA